MNKIQNIIDELDPTMTKCHECNKHYVFDGRLYQILGLDYKCICQPCFNTLVVGDGGEWEMKPKI